MNFLSRALAYVWAIISGSLTVLQLIELVTGIEAEELLGSVGGGVGSFLANISARFGDGIRWVAIKLNEQFGTPVQFYADCSEPPCEIPPDFEAGLTFVLFEFGTLAVVAAVSLIIFLLLARRVD